MGGDTHRDFLEHMKTLFALNVLQMIAIATLVVHAFREQPTGAQEAHPTIESANMAAPTAPRLDEQRLRIVIREELAMLLDRSGASPAVTTPPRNPSTDLQQREIVAQQIETYRTTGMITDMQMQELQSEIAKLDVGSRKEMMSRLIRALNSGDMKGRL